MKDRETDREGRKKREKERRNVGKEKASYLPTKTKRDFDLTLDLNHPCFPNF